MIMVIFNTWLIGKGKPVQFVLSHVSRIAIVFFSNVCIVRWIVAQWGRGKQTQGGVFWLFLKSHQRQHCYNCHQRPMTFLISIWLMYYLLMVFCNNAQWQWMHSHNGGGEKDRDRRSRNVRDVNAMPLFFFAHYHHHDKPQHYNATITIPLLTHHHLHDMSIG